ncbi:hypothetical protein BC332_02589 [Capsicum chinense]|nr:hypothetical protein BC332_02589 [Capsicum chinense]
MKSSIKNELYSDILDLSNLQSSPRPTINSGNNDSQDNDWCDLWSDDGDLCDDSTDKLDKTSEIDREWQRGHDQFHTIGYRDGLMAGKEASAQEGFNVGFRDSVYVGYNWGLVRDSNDISSNDNLLKNYQKELQSLIDESGLKLHLDTQE